MAEARYDRHTSISFPDTCGDAVVVEIHHGKDAGKAGACAGGFVSAAMRGMPLKGVIFQFVERREEEEKP